MRRVESGCGEKAEVFAPESAAEGGGEGGGGEGRAGHGGREGARVFDDEGELRVVGAELGAVVQVRGADYCDGVVGDEDLRGMSARAESGQTAGEAHLRVGIELFVNDIIALRVGVAGPRDRLDSLRPDHGRRSNTIVVRSTKHRELLLHLGHLGIAVYDSLLMRALLLRALFTVPARLQLLQPVIRAQVEKEDVLRGIDARGSYACVDRVLAATD